VLWVNLPESQPHRSVRDFGGMEENSVNSSGDASVAELFVFSPRYSVHGKPGRQMINRRLLRWSLRPPAGSSPFKSRSTWTSASSAMLPGSLVALVIYHCVDEFSKFTATDEAASRNGAQPMQKADMVVVSSSRFTGPSTATTQTPFS